jgi:LCP family protein required for cell wall assembly
MFLRKRLANTLLFLLIFSIFLSSCSALAFGIPNWDDFQQGVQNSNSVSLLIPPIGATPTPTPFQPLNPTPTYIPTAFPTPEPTPKPNKSISAGNTQPAGKLAMPENQINILLLGSDQRYKRGGYRTDTIILVSINTEAKTVSMVSFPRDLYIYIPGWTYQRINTAMYHGGFKLLAKTLNYNFGIKPEYYVMVNFSAFKQIINKLGGIDVEVARKYTDEYWDRTYKTIPAGTVHMNADIALWYARARKASNDFDRARRQQEVLHAIAKKVLSLNALENAKDIYEIYIDNVTTNLKWSEITPLIPLMVHFQDPSLIQRYVIGPGQVYDWITSGGAMVLLPRQNKIIALLQRALGTQ